MLTIGSVATAPWLANRGPGTNLDGLERRGGLPAAGELEHGGFVEGRGRVWSFRKSRLSKEADATLSPDNLRAKLRPRC